MSNLNRSSAQTRSFWVLAGLAGLAGSAAVASLVRSHRRWYRCDGELTSSGVVRRYHHHIPAGLDPATPVPLVIAIHGFFQSPLQQRRLTRWDALADTEGFVTVYPMGLGRPLRWPSHEAVASSQSTRDQVTFIADLIDEIGRTQAIDPDRVYASGMSNGGGLAAVLACELSDRIAAAGGVAGLYTYPLPAVPPGRPVSFIAFHGVLDRIVPYRGGIPRLGYPIKAVPEWVAQYAAMVGCNQRTDAEVTPAVRRTRYTGGPDGTEVVCYTVANGGHSWPGGDPLPILITGPTSNDVDATRLTWEFFCAHRRTPRGGVNRGRGASSAVGPQTPRSGATTPQVR